MRMNKDIERSCPVCKTHNWDNKHINPVCQTCGFILTPDWHDETFSKKIKLKRIKCPKCLEKGYMSHNFNGHYRCGYCGANFTLDMQEIIPPHQDYYICPVCGFTYCYTEKEKHICKFCGHENMTKTKYTADDFDKWLRKYQLHQMKEILRKKYTINSKYFNKDLYQAVIDEEREDDIRNDYDGREREYHQNQERINNIPKCPHCSSVNIQPITTGERVGSIMMLGMFSKKINKSFKCLNCKYTW